MHYKKGDIFYFDILGKTNKSDTLTVTLIKKRFINKYIVMSNQTHEIFITKDKYLIPINQPNVQMLIRPSNPLVKFDMVDYNILETTRTIINNILKSSSENDILLSKINKGFDMVMNKMCIIIKNDQESEIIDNIALRELLKEYNKIKNDNGEEEKIDKFEDYSDKQRTDTANKFINGMLDYFKHHLHLEIVSDDIIDDYVKDFYPPSLLLLSEKESYISVNINDIEKYSKDIYSRLSVLTIKRDLNLFIPYIDINTLKIECIHIHRSDSESDIFDKLKRVFIDDYKGKVPFRVCEIFYNINLYNNNDKEGDNIGED